MSVYIPWCLKIAMQRAEFSIQRSPSIDNFPNLSKYKESSSTGNNILKITRINLGNRTNWWYWNHQKWNSPGIYIYNLLISIGHLKSPISRVSHKARKFLTPGEAVEFGPVAVVSRHVLEVLEVLEVLATKWDDGQQTPRFSSANIYIYIYINYIYIQLYIFELKISLVFRDDNHTKSSWFSTWTFVEVLAKFLPERPLLPWFWGFEPLLDWEPSWFVMYQVLLL